MNKEGTPIMAEHHRTATATGIAEQKARLLAAQARRIIELEDAIAQAKDELDTLKSSILDRWPAGRYTADGLTVAIQPGRSMLDRKRFATAFPAARHPDCYDTAPLPLSRLEKRLGEDTVAPYVTHAKPTVKVIGA